MVVGVGALGGRRLASRLTKFNRLTTSPVALCQPAMANLSAAGAFQTRRQKYTYPKISEEEEKFIVRSPYPDVDIPECNMADFVWRDVDKWPEHVALVSFSLENFFIVEILPKSFLFLIGK